MLHIGLMSRSSAVLLATAWAAAIIGSAGVSGPVAAIAHVRFLVFVAVAFADILVQQFPTAP